MKPIDFLPQLAAALGSVRARSGRDCELTLGEGMAQLEAIARGCGANGGRLLFVGNGGSAAIASHMAVDYTKNFGIRALAFNDLAALTCMANDFGYVEVFARQIGYHATPDDVLVAISSSGRSQNILAAVEAARRAGCDAVVTLSGMGEDNPLRGLGDLNLWVPSRDYGIVEITHQALLHAVVSAAMSTNG